MPKTGRGRKAKPRVVYDAYQEAPAHPRPRADETFAQFLVRLEGGHDPLLELLIKTGYGEPSQREYLERLRGIFDDLYLIREKLSKKWRDEYHGVLPG